jgi:2-methylisocitrate lyase-like PEP mutase family enzyme
MPHLDQTTQEKLALRLRQLHHGQEILVLPNAWDAISARIFAEAGFPAIATTSGGIASGLGYPDGERISREEMLRVTGRIAGSVSVPVTADLEGGYGGTPEEIAETIRRAMGVGLVGGNLEDSRGPGEKKLRDVSLQVEIIKAIRETAAQAGIPFVLNARIDSFLYGDGGAAERLSEAIRRGKIYLEAGADCVFPIGVRDRETIVRLVQEISGPINILAGPGLPSIPELQNLKIARVSFGSGLMRGTFPLIRQIAEELRGSGTYHSFDQKEFTHVNVNQRFEE